MTVTEASNRHYNQTYMSADKVTQRRATDKTDMTVTEASNRHYNQTYMSADKVTQRRATDKTDMTVTEASNRHYNQTYMSADKVTEANNRQNQTTQRSVGRRYRPHAARLVLPAAPKGAVGTICVLVPNLLLVTWTQSGAVLKRVQLC